MEQRLIDVNALLNYSFRITGSFDLGNGRKQDFESVSVKEIEATPTIDPVHAAGRCYCKECINYHEAHYEETGEPEYIKGKCEFSSYLHHPNDFCSYGERRQK